MKSNLRRWDGPAAILGGILWLTYFILQTIAPAALTVEPYTVLNQTAEAIYSVILLLSLILFALGLVGLYVRQSGSAGSTGLVAKLGGATAILGGLLIAVGGPLVTFFDMDGTWYMLMGGVILLFLSVLLLGVSTLSTQVLGRWSFVPLLVGVICLTTFLSAFIGIFQLDSLGTWLGLALPALVGAGWILLGIALNLSRESAVQKITLDSAPAL